MISAAVTASASGTLLARTSLIHGEGASFPIFAVQSQDSRIGPFRGVHGREGKAAGAPGDLVHNNIDLVDRAVLGKHVPEIIFGDVIGKIPNV